jgi:hypothetical protein
MRGVVDCFVSANDQTFRTSVSVVKNAFFRG